jgi:hypothetical protein
MWLVGLCLAMLVIGCEENESAADDDDDDTSPATDDDDDDDNDNDDNDNDDDDNDDDDNDDNDPGDPIEPSAGYLARQAEYLALCAAGNGLYDQVCHAFVGDDEFNQITIQSSLLKINDREDTADFAMAAMLRLLAFDRENPVLPVDLRDDIEWAVLNFKYWLDEPGPDMMCWWSENHQILFHSNELMAGLLFPDDEFPNSGMYGTDHVAHATPLIHRWLDFRGLFGFSEFHSNVYFNEDMPALLNLADFADESEIALKAAMVLDVIAFDFAMNYYQGYFATAHGRTYEDHLLGGMNDSTSQAAYITLGLGEAGSSGSFTGTFLATSDRYWPPVVLEDIAVDAADSLEHRQRDSVNLADGPDFGIGYENWQDIMFWWGATGYVAPDVITGTFDLVEHFDLWDNYLWSDLWFLRIFVGSPLLRTVAEIYEPMSRGVALEAVSTYTYRTPYYQLSGAQDYKAAEWSAQVHIWQATLDGDAYVFTTYPGGFEDDYMAGPWTGGWQPRGTYYENVGVLQYWRPHLPIVDALLFVNYTHAYFPKLEFDEVEYSEHWTIARKGDAYVALYSQNPAAWSVENDYEWIADGRENVWLVELGDVEAFGSFAAFVEAIQNAAVDIGDTVSYDSPSLGLVEVGREGPLTVAGDAVDLGPYERWDNPYSQQAYGTNITNIEFAGQRFELDFATPRRRYWAGEE